MDQIGQLEQLVMLAILRLRPEAYGVALQKELKVRTGREYSVGAIYAVLDKLGAFVELTPISEVNLDWLLTARFVAPRRITASFAEQVRQPPALGEALLVLFCPKNRVDAVLGDLEERFHEHIKGQRRAKLLYW